MAVCFILEHYDFRLISEALTEREVILKNRLILLNLCAFVYLTARFYAQPG